MCRDPEPCRSDEEIGLIKDTVRPDKGDGGLQRWPVLIPETGVDLSAEILAWQQVILGMLFHAVLFVHIQSMP